MSHLPDRSLAREDVADERIRHSEARHRALVEATSAVTWACPPSGLRIEPQASWSAYTGRTGDDLALDDWLAFIHPDDVGRFETAWREALATGQLFAVDHRLRRHDGVWCWMIARAAPVRDAGGRIVEWFGMCFDISGRKKAERALHEQRALIERQFAEIEDLYRTAPVGLALVDPALVFVRVNRRLAEMNGVEAEAHVGRTLREVLGPALADVVEPLYRRVFDSGVPVVGLDIVGAVAARPAERRDWQVSYLPLRGPDGAVIGVNVVVNDITERKRAEEDRRSRADSQSFLLTLSDQLRALSDPEDIERAGVARLMAQLGADRCLIARLDESNEHATVGPEIMRRGLPPVAGRYPMSDFPQALGLARQGTLWLDDCGSSLLLSAQDRRALAALGIAALLAGGVRRGAGRLVWALAVASSTPRCWTLHEAELVEAVAERTWAAREQARTERELREAEHRFREVADAVPVLLWESRADGRRFVNRTALDYFGVTAEQLQDEAWVRRVHPDDVEAGLAVLQGAMQRREPYVLEWRMRRADGEYRWLLVHARPLGEGRYVGCALDFTKRKRAEEDRERFATVVEQSNDFIGFTSLDGAGLYVNRAGAERVGLPHPDGLREMSLADLLAPEDRRHFTETVIPAALASGLWQGEVAFRHFGSGECIPMEQSVFPLQAPLDGRPTPVATIARDARARKLVESRLRASEADYRLLFEASGVGNVEVEPASGRFVRANARYCGMLGYEAAELCSGMTVQQVTHPDDRARNAQVYRALLEGPASTLMIEKRYLRKDGGVVWGHTVATLIRDAAGNPARVLASAVDITERHRQEEQLRASERRFQVAAEAVNGFIYEFEREGRRVAVSGGIEPLLGLRPAEIAEIGHWNARLHSDDLPRLREVAHQAWEGRGHSYRYEYRVRHRDGHYVDVWDHAVMERDAAGRVVRVIGHVIDISDRRRAEERLLEADRRKDEFLAILAHELRNPLVPIRNGLRILQLAAGDAAAAERARAMMNRQVEQMTHLIDDLMDVSRISQGRFVLNKTRLRLADAVHTAIESARPLMEARGHDFEVDLPAEPIVVEGDPHRLSQVFANVLNNAANYTDPGGHVRLALRREGDEAVVTVDDDGMGIPPAMLTEVFEMFAQVDRSLEKSRGGLGLGLHIAMRLVRKHGGRITAESAGPGHGCRFTVRLPTAPAAAPGALAAETPASPGGPAGRRILVVDDNEDAASSLALMLDLMGDETRVAHDGLEAVALAESFAPEVVLMDIGMPRLNGFDACRRIRAQARGRTMVIVALTGWGQDEDRRHAAEAGFDLHLTKPVDPRALEQLLAERASSGSR